MPGNSWSRCAAMTSSSGTNRCASTGTNLGRICGTFTLAKCSVPVRGLRTITARLRERPEMYGNGCAGSTASGVRTGNTREPNRSCIRPCASASRSDQRRISICSLASSGLIWSWKQSAWRTISSRVRAQIASSTSRGSSPDAARTATPAAILRLSPATRTMKNSSRLLAKIARNRTRSSSGIWGSSASSSTRVLKCSQDSSRSRNRSPGRSPPLTSYGGSMSYSPTGRTSCVLTRPSCHRQVNGRYRSLRA